MAEPEERLRRAIHIYFTNIATYSASALLAYRESYVLTGEARELVKEMERETNLIFEGIIDDGIAAGAFRRCRVDVVTYDIVMLGHMWALKRWYLPAIPLVSLPHSDHLHPRGPASGSAVSENTEAEATDSARPCPAAVARVVVVAERGVSGRVPRAIVRDSCPRAHRGGSRGRRAHGGAWRIPVTG